MVWRRWVALAALPATAAAKGGPADPLQEGAVAVGLLRIAVNSRSSLTGDGDDGHVGRDSFQREADDVPGLKPLVYL